jgi:S-adenosylmethionine/arginine decarboxylase-like enzyme
MKKFGKASIKRFQGGGYFGKGFSFFQFITTSSIVGHFIEKDKIAFLNIFSCKVFNHKKAANFAKKFFKAKRIKMKIILH